MKTIHIGIKWRELCLLLSFTPFSAHIMLVPNKKKKRIYPLLCPFHLQTPSKLRLADLWVRRPAVAVKIFLCSMEMCEQRINIKLWLLWLYLPFLLQHCLHFLPCLLNRRLLLLSFYFWRQYHWMFITLSHTPTQTCQVLCQLTRSVHRYVHNNNKKKKHRRRWLLVDNYIKSIWCDFWDLIAPFTSADLIVFPNLVVVCNEVAIAQRRKVILCRSKVRKVVAAMAQVKVGGKKVVPRWG